jgi:hypothetical protein
VPRFVRAGTRFRPGFVAGVGEGGREGGDGFVAWWGQCLDEDATHGGVGPSCSTRLQLVPDVIHVFV